MSAIALVAGRSAREGARDPAPAYVLPLLPALLVTIVFSALFKRIAELPAFGVDDYIDYLGPGAVVLPAILAGGFTAASLGSDLRSGYQDRLTLLPGEPAALLLGRVAFEAVRVLPATAILLAIVVALGAPLDNGAAGAVAALILVALLSAAWGGVFHIVAAATADPTAPVALQPLGIAVGFLSTALAPADAMPAVAQAIANANPVSIVVEAVREAMAGDVVSADVALGLAVSLAGIAVTQLATARLLARQAGAA